MKYSTLSEKRKKIVQNTIVLSVVNDEIVFNHVQNSYCMCPDGKHGKVVPDEMMYNYFEFCNV